MRQNILHDEHIVILIKIVYTTGISLYSILLNPVQIIACDLAHSSYTELEDYQLKRYHST